VRRPSEISAPDRLSKSSRVRGSTDHEIQFAAGGAARDRVQPEHQAVGLPITPSTLNMTLSIFSELRAGARP